LNREIPIELQRIVNKSLEKNRSDRYQTVTDVLKDLRHLEVKEFNQLSDGSGLQSSERQIKSIVVLPLKNNSNESEQEYFVDGMTEALTTSLAKIHTLKVISRASAMHYKTSDKKITEIARELYVDAVVEGSVFRVDKKVRITAQLIHVATDTHIWAENYDRDYKDILLLQSEVAQAIAREIRVKLTQNEKKRLKVINPVHPGAYDAYLKGRFHWYKLSPQDNQKALEYFSLALEKDPEFALAHSGVAMVWLVRGYWGTNPPHKIIPKANTSSLKAIEIDDTIEEAHDVRARILYYYYWDWVGAEREFKYSIQLNPNNADVHLFYSSFLRSMGREEEARSEAELGLELDPLNSFTQCYFVGHLLYLKQYDKAILHLRKILSSEHDSPFVHRYLWICYHQKKMYDEAIEAAKNYFSTMGMGEFSDIIGRGYANSDYKCAMGLLAKSMEKHWKTTYIQPIWIARLYAHARNNDRALDWLENAYNERDFLMPNLNTSTDWEVLHKEERFIKLLKKMNFPQ